MVFGHHEGVPYQRAAEDVDSPLLFSDFSHLPDPDTAAHRWLDELSERVFDLSRCSFSAAIVKLEPRRWLFFINQHHITTDFSSVAILVRRLDILYREALEGSIETAQFPSFIDFLDRHPEVIGQTEAKRHGPPAGRDRRKGLFGLASAPAPVRLHRHEVLVGAERLARLRRFCRAEIDRGGVDFGMFDVLAAAYGALLIRASADETVIIGTTYANRYLPEAKDIAGPLIRMVPLQVATAESRSFHTLLESATSERRRVFGACKTGLPVEPQPYRFAFNYLTSAMPGFLGAPTEDITRYEANAASDLDLTLTVRTRDVRGDIKLIFDLNERLLQFTSVESLAERFLAQLDALLEDPGRRFDAIPLTGADAWRNGEAATRRALLHKPRFRSLPEAFLRQARQTSEHEALSEGGRALSYAELELQSRRIGAALVKRGSGEGSVVALQFHRSIELVVALLGIMRSGAAFLAMEPGLPEERARHMLNDAGATLLLNGPDVARCPGSEQIETICLEDLVPEADAIPANLMDDRSSATAYIQYTSGSTGRPKGVIVPHESFARFLDWYQEIVLGGGALTVAFSSSIGFDASLRFFAALASGGSVRIYPENPSLHEFTLSRVLGEDAVDVVLTTPSALRLVVDRVWSLSRIRKLVVMGEEFTRDLALRAREALGHDVEILNCYGPTEAVLASTFHRFDPARDQGAGVPIGKPATDVTVHVLDAGRNPLPSGFVGEIYIGGARLASGYANLPDLTEERFVPDPFAPDRRLYRTGDLGRTDQDGNLSFQGRIDDQVKVNGVRIEPAEIEHVLLSHGRVKRCVIRADKAEKTRLVAYYAARDAIPVSELRATCARHLTGAMIPAFFVWLEEIPLTERGKVDYNALPPTDGRLLSKRESGSGVLAATPATKTEQLLARAWEKGLELQGIYRRDDFFDLGGDSLIAAAISAEIHAETGVQMTFRVFAERSALKDMARFIDDELSTSGADGEILPAPISHEDRIPISLLQMPFWRASHAAIRSRRDRQASVVRINGRLDVEAFQASFSRVIERHESLRTRFGLSDGTPVQIVEPSRRFALPFIDLSRAADPTGELERLVELEAAREFDLTAAPPVSFNLVKITDQGFALVISSHHIITDAQSWNIFLRDIVIAYEGSVSGSKPSWPPLPIQYSDYAVWQRLIWRRDGPKYQSAIAQLKKQLQGSPILPNVRSFRRYWRQEFSGSPQGLVHHLGVGPGDVPKAQRNRSRSEGDAIHGPCCSGCPGAGIADRVRQSGHRHHLHGPAPCRVPRHLRSFR